MTPPPAPAPKCPRCHAPMKKRVRVFDDHLFWGCSTFPKCRGTRDTRNAGRYDWTYVDGDHPDPGADADDDPFGDCYSSIHDGD